MLLLQPWAGALWIASKNFGIARLIEMEAVGYGLLHHPLERVSPYTGESLRELAGENFGVTATNIAMNAREPIFLEILVGGSLFEAILAEKPPPLID
jgi:hypothetical protein